MEFHVSPSGNDTAAGTAKAPFRTVERAKMEVRKKISTGLQEPVTVLLHGGTYELSENHIHDVHRSAYAQGSPNNGFFIDAGSKGFLFESNVVYKTAGKAKAVRFNQSQQAWHTWTNNFLGDKAAKTEAAQAIIRKAGIEVEYR